MVIKTLFEFVLKNLLMSDDAYINILGIYPPILWGRCSSDQGRSHHKRFPLFSGGDKISSDRVCGDEWYKERTLSRLSLDFNSTLPLRKIRSLLSTLSTTTAVSNYPNFSTLSLELIPLTVYSLTSLSWSCDLINLSFFFLKSFQILRREIAVQYSLPGPYMCPFTHYVFVLQPR